MPERARLLSAIADIMGDYRTGQIDQADPEHVDRWVRQFPVVVQEPILTEMAHVLRQTYFSRHYVTQFFSALITYQRLAGDDPCSFWRAANFLRLQTAGNSQRDLLGIFDTQLREQYNIGLNECGQGTDTYVYIDDALFSGGRIKSDLIGWINGAAPINATVFYHHHRSPHSGAFFRGEGSNPSFKGGWEEHRLQVGQPLCY